MSLNRKELSILEELNKSIKISLTYFAEKYNVSERNIRYSIENLNYYLLKFSLAEIKIKKGEVYWSIEQENLKNFIESIDIENYIFSKEERENYILISYLFSEKTKITDIEKYLKISRPTIKKDLLSLDGYLKEFEVGFIREENTIFIVGKEKKLRHLKLLKLLEYLDIKNGKVEYLEKIYLTEKKELEIVKRYLEKFDIPKYYNIILQIERELKVEFDTKFKKLMCIYLISTIERIDKNFIITKKDNSKFLSQLTD
ncbi:MAG: helix-turn-helix domain-containing protein [Candidatus Fusobacterium pullicola]|nr:helix-turn-helix domain-containing protein [Candidatus Fusobacterium pullicola]